jgi:hypothetical protein
MSNKELTNEQFALIEPLLASGAKRSAARTARAKLFIEAVLFRFETGTAWTCLPSRFGLGFRIHDRFKRWAETHQWKRLLDAFQGRPDVPMPGALAAVVEEEARIQPTSKPPRKRGFATMSLEQRREIARKGGSSVAPENRSFSRDRDLAARAGMIGGETSSPKREKSVHVAGPFMPEQDPGTDL